MFAETMFCDDPVCMGNASGKATMMQLLRSITVYKICRFLRPAAYEIVLKLRLDRRLNLFFISFPLIISQCFYRNRGKTRAGMEEAMRPLKAQGLAHFPRLISARNSDGSPRIERCDVFEAKTYRVFSHSNESFEALSTIFGMHHLSGVTGATACLASAQVSPNT